MKKQNTQPPWTVKSKEKEKPDSVGLKTESVFIHSLCYQGKKVHSLTGDNGKTILTETAARYNDEGYAPTISGTKMLFELSATQRKKLDDEWAKSVPDLFPLEGEVES
jgi:hypothetical protein